jgi:hypothetical protein
LQSLQQEFISAVDPEQRPNAEAIAGQGVVKPPAPVKYPPTTKGILSYVEKQKGSGGSSSSNNTNGNGLYR